MMMFLGRFLVDCTRLIIPIINEVFGEHYTGEETIIHHSDYHFYTRCKMKEKQR